MRVIQIIRHTRALVTFAALFLCVSAMGQPGESRTSNAVELITLSTAPLEFSRHASRRFDVASTRQPLLARMQCRIWHQGTDHKPVVLVNGENVGELEPFWPSLTHRNYVTYVFDDQPVTSSNFQFDYQGWLGATCVIEGKFLKAGMNEIVLKTGDDQVLIRDIRIELLTRLDSEDSLSDNRKIKQPLFR